MKKILLFIVLALLIILGYSRISKIYRRDAKDISVSGDKVSMTLGKQDITAEAVRVSGESFLINSMELSSVNTGNFFVIPMERVKYLEGKYSDFTHCDSPGEQEGKNSIIGVGFIAKNQDAEKEMKKVKRLFKKESKMPVIEISGSKLEDIEGLEEKTSNYGLFVVAHENPDTYYLVSNMKIVEEDYQ